MYAATFECGTSMLWSVIQGQALLLLDQSRANARRPRVSKLRAKGLSDYHSNETLVEAARWWASGPNKKATLTKCLLKKGELKRSYLLD
jgi:hypothetical protein